MEFEEAAGVCFVLCFGLCTLGFFFGSDIAALLINSYNDCNDTIIGQGHYILDWLVNPSLWINIGGSSHFLVLIIACGCVWLSVENNEKPIVMG
eukprot:829673_1